MKQVLLLVIALAPACAPGHPEVAAWKQQAANVTITRDDWGIAHVAGKTDADAVFGMIYAQAEDDFNRVETNYLNAMGRLAEAEGEAEIWRDLRMKLFINPDSLQAMYGRSPAWLQGLMTAWADGLNYYLHTHPEVTPRVITRFEPWMALSFSEGSIGGDIEQVSLTRLAEFYGQPLSSTSTLQYNLAGRHEDMEPRGSNGIAIAPSNTVGGHALLLINPHTSFFFRSELQMTSDEGLNAYGAVTWGQFFIYQGFNERAGWMHTSSGVDNIDEYLETAEQRDGGWVYRAGTEERPVSTTTITVLFKTDTGMASREFTGYRTHHGPVVREQDGRWVSVRLMEEPIKALTQSFTRTKATNYQTFRETMALHTNSSNNTVLADVEGNIAYFHANFVPRRETRFDWRRPVDGTDPATEWQGVHEIDESPNVVNPSIGWVYNTNNWPYTAAGPDSPKQADYPSYMDRGEENPRGVHAIRVLQGRKDFTVARLIEAAHDTWLPAFEDLIPGLVKAWEHTPGSDPLKAKLAEPVAMLRGWDRRWSVESVATAVAVFWGEELWRRARTEDLEDLPIYQYLATRAAPGLQLGALAAAVDQLETDFGTWKTPWGEINRFQRISPAIAHPFSDSAPSIPVGFTSSRWGSLASFGTRRQEGQKRLYGTSGNSFVAVVEFGDSVRARAVTAGGLSGNPLSPHFNDQAERYSTGDLREVYFYRNHLEGHIEREYHPGR